MEFDLEHLKINVNRMKKIWLDLVFETPNLNSISLINFGFSKRPLGEISFRGPHHEHTSRILSSEMGFGQGVWKAPQMQQV